MQISRSILAQQMRLVADTYRADARTCRIDSGRLLKPGMAEQFEQQADRADALADHLENDGDITLID